MGSDTEHNNSKATTESAAPVSASMVEQAISKLPDVKQHCLQSVELRGPILPLLINADMQQCCIVERHVCIDTTAAGGNASLLAANA